MYLDTLCRQMRPHCMTGGSRGLNEAWGGFLERSEPSQENSHHEVPGAEEAGWYSSRSYGMAQFLGCITQGLQNKSWNTIARSLPSTQKMLKAGGLGVKSNCFSSEDWVLPQAPTSQGLQSPVTLVPGENQCPLCLTWVPTHMGCAYVYPGVHMHMQNKINKPFKGLSRIHWRQSLFCIFKY